MSELGDEGGGDQINYWRDKYYHLKDVDSKFATQLQRAFERNARLVRALRMTLTYIDSQSHIIEIADVGKAQALLTEIDRALKGETDEGRPTGGDATGAARES